MYACMHAIVCLSLPSFTVILKPSLVSVSPQGLQSVAFTCTTDTGGTLWILQVQLLVFSSSSSAVNDTGSLGAFTVRLVSVDGSNLISTATVTDTTALLSSITAVGNITLTCDDNGDGIGGDTAVLIVNGN